MLSEDVSTAHPHIPGLIIYVRLVNVRFITVALIMTLIKNWIS